MNRLSYIGSSLILVGVLSSGVWAQVSYQPLPLSFGHITHVEAVEELDEKFQEENSDAYDSGSNDNDYYSDKELKIVAEGGTFDPRFSIVLRFTVNDEGDQVIEQLDPLGSYDVLLLTFDTNTDKGTLITQPPTEQRYEYRIAVNEDGYLTLNGKPIALDLDKWNNLRQSVRAALLWVDGLIQHGGPST